MAATMVRRRRAAQTGTLRERSLRRRAITALCRENPWTTEEAGEVIDYIIKLVARCRKHGCGLTHLTTEELRSPNYRRMDAIFPHNVPVASDGSARALVEELVLNTKKGEIGLIHGMTREQAGLTYCNVALRLATVRI